MKRSLVAVSTVLAVVCVQFSPVLRGRVYRFEDIAAYFEPLWTASAAALRHGRLPLWDEGAWSGYPVIGDPQVGALYPPNWLATVMPVLRAYALCAMLHAAWAGLGMYALCRVRGRSRAASALAGIALGVSGYVVLQVRHVMFVEATAWIPWVLACGWRFVEKHDRAALAGTAVSTGMLLLTGGESMIYYGAAFIVAVLLPRALRPSNAADSDGPATRNPVNDGPATGNPTRERAVNLLGLGAAALLGLGLSAPSWLPAAAHGAVSPRALGTDAEFAGSVAWSGLHLLPSLFLPNLLGQQVRGDYVGGGTQWEIAGYYAGMLTFALAIYALAAGPRQRRAERIAVAALFVAAVLLAPGNRSPLHALAFRFLPLYSAMRCPCRALYVFTLGVPMLAADGLDLALSRTRLRLRPFAATAAVLLVAADLLFFQRAENPSQTLAAARAQAFPDELLALLAAHGDERHATDVHLPQPFHNSGLLWSSSSTGGYSSLPIWRYLHLQWIANHGAPYPHAKLHDDLAAQGLWHLSSPLVDALAVRWFISDGKHPPEGSGWTHRHSTAGLPDGPTTLELWENDEALPFGWVVHRAHVVDGEPAAARAVADPAFNPRVEAILERAPAPVPSLPASGESFERVTAFTRLGPGDYRYTLDLTTPGVLVVPTPTYPARRGTLDGNPANLLVADYALTAVAVPAGHHELRLEIASPALDAALAAMAISALLLLALPLLRRRNGAAA